VGNVSMNVYAKFRCTPLCIKKALGIFRELITTTRRRTTRVAFWSPPFGSNNWKLLEKMPFLLPNQKLQRSVPPVTITVFLARKQHATTILS